MSIREVFVSIVLLFLAYYAYGMTFSHSSPTNDYCDVLPQKEFSVAIYEYEQVQLQNDDFPRNDRRTIEGESIEFQEDRAKIIHIQAYNPKTGEQEESYLADDTHFFTSFLVGLELVGKARQGQSITQGEINGLRLHLNKLKDHIDIVDDSWLMTDLLIERDVEQILALLDNEPLDIDALYQQLNEMGYNNSNPNQGWIVGSSKRMRGYEGVRERQDENHLNWEPFAGIDGYVCTYAHVNDKHFCNFRASLGEQLFTALLNTASGQLSRCSEEFAKSTVRAENKKFLVEHRSMPAALFDLLRGGDSRRENVPVSVNQSQGLR